MKLAWPMPPPGASYPRRLLQMVILPIAVGLGFGFGLAELVGSTWMIVVVTPPALVWSIREYRWAGRMRREIIADEERFERSLREIGRRNGA
jgi:hypothetical protein